MDRIRRLISTLGVVLTLVAALSLAAAGGAHRMDLSDAAQEAFAAVYGVSADICGDDQGQGALNGDCPVCHLVAAALLPEPTTGDLATELRFVAAVVLPQSQRAIKTPTDPARSLRGPPVV
jgi:cytochrome c5